MELVSWSQSHNTIHPYIDNDAEWVNIIPEVFDLWVNLIVTIPYIDNDDGDDQPWPVVQGQKLAFRAEMHWSSPSQSIAVSTMYYVLLHVFAKYQCISAWAVAFHINRAVQMWALKERLPLEILQKVLQEPTHILSLISYCCSTQMGSMMRIETMIRDIDKYHHQPSTTWS